MKAIKAKLVGSKSWDIVFGGVLIAVSFAVMFASPLLGL